MAVTPEFLLEVKSVTPMALEFLELAVRSKQNTLVSGGTGSGKTTMLNILSHWFDPTHRIVVIEDTRELQVQQEHVVNMEARPADEFGKGEITIRDMFVASLRMRPDRIVVGEIRRGEAIDMIQAMNSGHGGTMATVHADSPLQACGRMEVMALMAQLGLPIDALRRQIGQALNLVVQASRLNSGRRCVTHISEIGFDNERETYSINDIFLLKNSGGELSLEWTGNKPSMGEELDLYGLRERVDLTAEMWK
jgi:pilus assembly protein CpaF